MVDVIVVPYGNTLLCISFVVNTDLMENYNLNQHFLRIVKFLTFHFLTDVFSIILLGNNNMISKIQRKTFSLKRINKINTM